MSLIKLSGNPSGTGAFTIAAPNSNTDRTLTLPDATGTVNVSGLANEVPAGSAGAPAIYPTGDTNTGIFFPAADTIAFSEGGTEAMRIDSSGRLLVKKTVANNLTVNGFEIAPDGNIFVTSTLDTAQFYRKTSSTGNGVLLTYSDVGGAASLVGAAFANGTFGAVSDASKKKNVEDARGYLDDLMQIRVVKYNWITDEDTAPKELGWIAQEVEQVFPGMVTDFDNTKILKKEVFLPMLIKAIQEQQAQIEDLKAEVAALKGASA